MLRSKMFSSNIWNSKTDPQKITAREKWLGYMLGPAGILTLNAILTGYLNRYYTDVLLLNSAGWGVFLAMMPVLSKILDAITNIIMGQIIERTRTRQGKARVWMIISLPIIVVSAVLLFVIPAANNTVKAIWITFSYNLYYCLGYTMYSMSHNLMMPLATTDSKQRDTLAIFNNVANNIIPGLFTIIFPMCFLGWMGQDQGRWITIIAVFSIIAIPAVFLEYYFTRERVTEAQMKAAAAGKKEEVIPLRQQIAGCLKSKYWVYVVCMMVCGAILVAVSNASKLYYCSWVLADNYADGAGMYTIVNAIGQFPLGIGVFLVFPLIKKFGKRNSMLVGCTVAVIGAFITVLFPKNLTVLLAGLIIFSFGCLPNTYAGSAMLADSMDYVEYKQGFRCDGFTISLLSIANTIAAGIGTGVLNFSLMIINDYDATLTVQSAGVQTALVVLALGAPLLAQIINVLFLIPNRQDKEMAVIHDELERRRTELMEKIQ